MFACAVTLALFCLFFSVRILSRTVPSTFPANRCVYVLQDAGDAFTHRDAHVGVCACNYASPRMWLLPLCVVHLHSRAPVREGVPPTFPKSPPRKALILNRRKDRVMLNADAVVAMIEPTSPPNSAPLAPFPRREMSFLF